MRNSNAFGGPRRKTGAAGRLPRASCTAAVQRWTQRPRGTRSEARAECQAKTTSLKSYARHTSLQWSTTSPTQHTPTTRHVDSTTDARRRRVSFVSVLCGTSRARLFHSRETPPRWVGSSQSAHESRTRLRESSGKPLAPVAELHTHHLKRCGGSSSNCRPWRRWTSGAAAHSRPKSSNSARGIARSSP